ncbi:MAG: putative nucleic acid-binding protein [Cyclobacteriaceae bacterium]|jgi:predicted nucleic acid-binding protein
MNGNKFLLDTNIILYLLNGEETLVEILEGKRPFISFITELELYGFRKLNEADKTKIDSVLAQCTIIDINAGIKLSTINIRREYKIKLPDSIIAGTSLYLGIPLVTADNGFNKIENLDLVYYQK